MVDVALASRIFPIYKLNSLFARPDSHRSFLSFKASVVHCECTVPDQHNFASQPITKRSLAGSELVRHSSWPLFDTTPPSKAKANQTRLPCQKVLPSQGLQRNICTTQLLRPKHTNRQALLPIVQLHHYQITACCQDLSIISNQWFRKVNAMRRSLLPRLHLIASMAALL